MKIVSNKAVQSDPKKLINDILYVLPENSDESVSIKTIRVKVFVLSAENSYHKIATALELMIGKNINGWRVHLVIKISGFGPFTLFPCIRFFKSRCLRPVPRLAFTPLPPAA